MSVSKIHVISSPFSCSCSISFKGGRLPGHKITRLQPEVIFFPPTGLCMFKFHFGGNFMNT